MNRSISASLFSAVLGISGLGYAWRVASVLWRVPTIIAETILAAAALIWAVLLLAYAWQALTRPELARREFSHPLHGSMPALIAIATLVLVPAALPYSRMLAWTLALAGVSWHLVFTLWHTGLLWTGERQLADTTPALYLPTVAGNFTSAAALGILAGPEWGYLFLGAGFFSWLSLEPIIMQALWHAPGLPPERRPLLGIHAAPSLACVTTCLAIRPGSTDMWLLMLWGYGLFQLMLGLRLRNWLARQPFSRSHWAYTFGITSGLTDCLKFAVTGVAPARALALPFLAGATLFIAYLLWCAALPTFTHLRPRRQDKFPPYKTGLPALSVEQ